jgi:phosphopantetheinyl transferase
LPEFPRNSAGAPVPYSGNWHWSTTNTHGLAAGVIAPGPVALDAEWLARPRLDAARSYLDEAELELLPDGDAPRELVLWTAKEVVLKLAGVGLAGLPHCRLVAAPAPDSLVVEHDGRRHVVHSRIAGEHVLAFACAAESPAWQLHELDEVSV